MKKTLILGVLLFVMAATLETSLVQAFNSATHLYITEQVFPFTFDKIDLYYGTIAPDLDMFVTPPENWPTAFEDTHKNFIDLQSDAWTPSQKAFKKGWFIHNGVRGADFYAHGKFPQSKKGYVIIKAKLLMPGAEGLMLDFAHTIIETAVDLLVKYNLDPEVGAKLQKACSNRSLQDLWLLVKVFVYEEGVTDWVTLVSAESFFREITTQYASLLSLLQGQDQEALAQFIAQIAYEMYGIEVPPGAVAELLGYAIYLCQDDYQEAIDAAIRGIKKVLRN